MVKRKITKAVVKRRVVAHKAVAKETAKLLGKPKRAVFGKAADRVIEKRKTKSEVLRDAWNEKRRAAYAAKKKRKGLVSAINSSLNVQRPVEPAKSLKNELLAIYPRSFNRNTYRELDERERRHVEQVKEAATALEYLLIGIGGRYQSLAMTALEQSVMWAVKGITG